jgi:hypothetical protein
MIRNRFAKGQPDNKDAGKQPETQQGLTIDSKAQSDSPQPANQAPCCPGDILVANGEVILKRFEHGSDLIRAGTMLAQKVAEGIRAGYELKLVVGISSADALLVFNRKCSTANPAPDA